MNPGEIATAIVALNGGKLAGRTRLQKTAYLLDQLGMKSGLTYGYHHYGPYSFELAQGWDLANLAGKLTLEEQEGRHGFRYTTFSTATLPPEKLGKLSSDRAKRTLSELSRQSDVVLELAATLRFFAVRGDVLDPETEVRQRKPVKATPERMAKAKSLLSSLGFSQPAAKSK